MAKKDKIDVEGLPIYSNPTLLLPGDKAKFYYDRAQKDCVMVDILKIEDAPLSGFYITWCMSHDTSKEFRTFVRPGERNTDDPDWIVGTTLTAKSVRAIPQYIKCNESISTKNIEGGESEPDVFG